MSHENNPYILGKSNCKKVLLSVSEYMKFPKYPQGTLRKHISTHEHTKFQTLPRGALKKLTFKMANQLVEAESARSR